MADLVTGKELAAEYAHRRLGGDFATVLEVSTQLRDDNKALPILNPELIDEFDDWVNENVPAAPLRRATATARRIASEWADALGEPKPGATDTTPRPGEDSTAALINKLFSADASDNQSPEAKLMMLRSQKIAATRSSESTSSSAASSTGPSPKELEAQIDQLSAQVDSRRVLSMALALRGEGVGVPDNFAAEWIASLPTR